MRPRQVLLLSVLLVVVPALVFGSGGFSGVAGERGIDVAVVNDESAYLGIEIESAEGYVDGEPFPVLELTDQHSGDLTLQSVESGDSLIEVETEMEPAPNIGETDPFTVEASCTEEGDGTVPITVVADGPGTHISVQRAVPVTCHEPVIHSVGFDFEGCGTARIEADDAIYPLNVTKVIDNPSADGNATSTERIYSNGRVGPGQGGKLVAIEADGERYENENRCTDGGKGQPVETDGENGRPAETDDE